MTTLFGDEYRLVHRLNDPESDSRYKTVLLCEKSNDTNAQYVLKKATVRNEEEEDQLHKEAEFHRLLNHRNIGKCFKLVHHSAPGAGEWFVVREFGDETLSDRIASGNLSADESEDIIQSLCEGLAYLHSRDPLVVHGGVRPSNVIFSKSGDKTPRLVDFGELVRTACSSATGTTYRSPERIQKGNLSASDDMWALGLLLVELLGGVSVAEFYDTDEPPAELDEEVIQEKISELGNPVVARLLQKDPGKRPTAAQVVSELSGSVDSPTPGSGAARGDDEGSPAASSMPSGGNPHCSVPSASAANQPPGSSHGVVGGPPGSSHGVVGGPPIRVVKKQSPSSDGNVSTLLGQIRSRAGRATPQVDKGGNPPASSQPRKASPASHRGVVGGPPMKGTAPGVPRKTPGSAHAKKAMAQGGGGRTGVLAELQTRTVRVETTTTLGPEHQRGSREVPGPDPPRRARFGTAAAIERKFEVDDGEGLGVLLSTGVDANSEQYVDEMGNSLLQQACLAQAVRCVARLVEHGASLSFVSHSGETPLHTATRVGHVRIANMLLEHGALVNERGPNGQTPLHLACRGAHREIVLWLLRHGADAGKKLRKFLLFRHTPPADLARTEAGDEELAEVVELATHDRAAAIERLEQMMALPATYFPAPQATAVPPQDTPSEFAL